MRKGIELLIKELHKDKGKKDFVILDESWMYGSINRFQLRDLKRNTSGFVSLYDGDKFKGMFNGLTLEQDECQSLYEHCIEYEGQFTTKAHEDLVELYDEGFTYNAK